MKKLMTMFHTVAFVLWTAVLLVVVSGFAFGGKASGQSVPICVQQYSCDATTCHTDCFFGGAVASAVDGGVVCLNSDGCTEPDISGYSYCYAGEPVMACVGFQICCDHSSICYDDATPVVCAASGGSVVVGSCHPGGCIPLGT